MCSMREFQGELVAEMVDMDWDEEEALFGLALVPEFCKEAGPEMIRAIHTVHHLFEADPEAHFAAA